jgi:hypothetical protein
LHSKFIREFQGPHFPTAVSRFTDSNLIINSLNAPTPQ